MVKIAIVEDTEAAADHIEECLIRYQQEHQQTFLIDKYKNGLSFVVDYKPYYDIVFMDIDMPHMNGMETSQIVYKKDKEICIIFVTNLAQYAINGYEVNALDYVLKPVTYREIADKTEKALKRISARKKDEVLILKESEAIRLPVDDIFYIEVINHQLIYHTCSGNYEVRGKLKEKEEQLRQYGFSRCNSGYLVNLMHVKKIGKGFVEIGNTQLPISRGRVKSFLNDFLTFLGESNG